MKQHLSEQATLFISVIKWAFFATFVGILVGIGTTVFLRTLLWASTHSSAYDPHHYSLPVVILISSLLVRWLAPDAAGHGTEKVIEAVHQRMGKIPVMVIPVKLLATVITLAGGGSAGKEGPAAQIGAGLASVCADVLRVADVDRRKLVICGISAGFATVFGTPIAGAIFGVEVLVLGQLFYDVLFPSFVAGIVGYHVALELGGVYPHTIMSTVPIFSGWSLVEIIFLGVWCGFAALLLIETVKLVHRSADHIQWHWTIKAILGGILLVGIGSICSPDYLGLGLGTIEQGLHGVPLPMSALFLKSIATSITLSSGGSGGVVTPIFYVGTAAGNLYGRLFNPEYLAVYSAIGMVALLAGAANTPIAASIMAIELFGTTMAPYAALACMVSYLTVGYRSIYPSQILGSQKSTSLLAPTGLPINSLPRVTINSREKSVIGIIKKRRKQRH